MYLLRSARPSHTPEASHARSAPPYAARQAASRVRTQKKKSGASGAVTSAAASNTGIRFSSTTDQRAAASRPVISRASA